MGLLTKKDSPPKEAPARDKGDSSSDGPPSYSQEQRLSLELPRLDLTRQLRDPLFYAVSTDQVVAHLKLLTVLADLRDTISNKDGLFGISDAAAELLSEEAKAEAQARIREKRWAVYTARAVDRYTKWWQVGLPSSHAPFTMTDVEREDYENQTTRCTTLVAWDVSNLPPIDVLMVWHSHMLNPRNFLEDCIRYGKMSTWVTGFPWDPINRCINDRTMEYTISEQPQRLFEQQVQVNWDNLDDPPNKEIQCPACSSVNLVPWTTGDMGPTSKDAFKDARGYADNSFETTCNRCKLIINHDLLKVAKFRNDAEALLNKNLPMPGTFYNINGLPEGPPHTNSGRPPHANIISRDLTHQNMMFANRLIKATANELLATTDARLRQCKSIDDLRTFLESKLTEKSVLLQTCGSTLPILRPAEKVHFRRMMSRYWDNLGPFALDLVGAVIRQGTFVQKMDNIDWLHSPTVMDTAERTIAKYMVFFGIMMDHPRNMAVPTLDVDLAWHTHQLAPSRYYTMSTTRGTKNARRFIDHDDKVDENKLSEGFEWTSRMYRRATNGGIYSECTCWYCEATRAPDLYDRMFAIGSSSRARRAADSLHDNPDVSSDPDKNPHISAHNAVRPKADSTLDDRAGRLQRIRLQQWYEKSARRAEKRGRPRSDSRSAGDGGYGPMYYYPYAWGYPMMVPYYGPYMCDPGVNSASYACNPSCMSLASGATGNCAAGTCGGAVAAGGCGGIGAGAGCAGAACAGGGAVGGAACAGAAGGGCGGGGGGGFGGCGGGGGGCGGGGGGGGGGCGGGGGGG
ncbi:hypothetical protein N7474_009458 [Penicillium riverlandense]|uniref:uncharacterized protein n=1 Tax=Penicillium riverlandense TaxID=1903569 RepID=UPI002546C1C1|nr:uncharacterized protein N7474_009458 [Penicillium riverlandense]KAJ5808189.1 hypothetical protein N7474_009458 [Penicillium riverlandense]